MRQQRMVPFKISSMDSLGQGVSKETDKITFISKTLPGDAGDARVTAEKKGVAFAKLESLKENSPLRIRPECPHFSTCPSCHYLHTDYQNELKFKQQSLEKLFYKMVRPEIKIVPAIRRTHYRNRIQLHYEKGKKLLGMLDAKDHTIAPIPNCLIGTARILQKLKELYENQYWLNLAMHQPDKGHVEIYELNGEINLNWNQSYAHGGFTQVFDEMNQLLRKNLSEWSHTIPKFEMLDLFAGNGNLSDKLNHSNRLCVDVYNKTPEGPFISQDLYDESALKNVKKKIQSEGLSPELMLLDPPRSGLKNLDQWVAEFGPQKIIYVSCDPHTMVRDITSLKNYRITDLQLYDFFPSTFHFETVAFLERN